MKDKLYINNLLDFYSELLTNKQQDICNLYYRNDYSISEIAEIQNISRNAVFDTIKRSEELLNEYESKLKTYNSYKKRVEYYSKIKSITDNNEIINLIDKCIDTEI